MNEPLLPESPAPTPNGELVIYESPDGTIHLEVRVERETVWLSLQQMAALFERDKSVISRHLRNIYREGELDRESTVAFFATVQNEGGRQVRRQIEYYNLDAIIAVGYRVNSRRGTQFRIWATQVLRDHILKGYTVNQQRLAELRQAIQLISTVSERRELSGEETTGLLRILHEYAFALSVLDAYDHGQIPQPTGSPMTAEPLSYEEACTLIAKMRSDYPNSQLFGLEQGQRLAGILSTVFQTVGGQDAYPTLAEKAAHLLYFLVKDHPFVDGNKRIGAALFLRFLEKNQWLYRNDGTARISEEALVALTLLVAESPPREKDVIVRLIAFLLQGSPSL
ncbi:MAG: virulence protein RhuM/Fic/DOC family protein [Fimbriimonadales bacterium]|nr:MAG: death-on-curing protein [Fimbriimonadales bacterium]